MTQNFDTDGNLSPHHSESHDEDFDLFDDADFADETATNDNQSTNWGLILGIIVTMVAISFIVFDGLKAETYFFAVDEAIQRGDDLVGMTIRVKGVVEDGTLVGTPGRLEHRFRVAENGQAMDVVYHKALPDTFQEGSEVVIQGKIDASFLIHADEVLVKCPSRYEGQPPTMHES